MNLKTVFLVVILSVLIGIVLFTGEKFLKKDHLTSPSSLSPSPSSFYPATTPAPKPSLPPINSNSNLKEELEKLTPPDFFSDISSLRQQF